jgi:hypothetical protein
MIARPGLLVAALVVAAPRAVPAEEASRPVADAPYLLEGKVGETAWLCRTGAIVCPAVAPLCDDGSIVQFELTASQGLGFRGAREGETLCSVASSSGGGPRRVFRVKVLPAGP